MFDEAGLPHRSQYRVQAGNRRALYGHMVEFGTTYMAPQPLPDPAFEQEAPGDHRTGVGSVRTP